MIGTRFLLRWVISSFLALLGAATVLAVLSPCAMLTRAGSGFLGAWMLYHATLVLLGLATSILQAAFLRSMGPFGLAWIVSATAGWLVAGIIYTALPFSLIGVVAPWIVGGLLVGALQWAIVFRSKRRLMWIPASVVTSLAVPAVAALISYIIFIASRSSALQSSPQANDMVLAMFLNILAIGIIASLSVVSSSAVGGVSYSLIFVPKVSKAA